MNKWLPEWTDPANYPDSETTSMGEWAWEFLRRNPLYQADYDELVNGCEQIGFREARLANYAAVRSGDKIKSEKLCEILKREYKRMMLVENEYKVMFSQEIKNPKWPDPTLSYEEAAPIFVTGEHLTFYNFFSGTQTTYGKYDSISLFCGLPSKEHCSRMGKEMNKEACIANNRTTSTLFNASARTLTVQISLEHPLTEQLKVIKKVANIQQKQLSEWGIFKKGRKELDRYTGYLQLLDALESGAKKQKILEILFPNLPNEYPDHIANKNFNNWKSAAEKLCNSDYLKIAALHYSEES